MASDLETVMASLRLKLEGIVWLAGWRLVRALPERWVRRASEAMFARSYRKNTKRRELVTRNLEPVVGAARAEATAREAFTWYSRYWVETFRMPDLSRAQFEARHSSKGAEHIQAAVDAGSGCILATLHQGNWDAGGRFVAQTWGLTVVVEVLKPRALFERFVTHRRRLGMKIVPLERGGDATARCEKELRNNGVIALVADRDLSGTGIEVQMFGRTTKLPPGPAVLSLRTGAPILPASIYQRENGDWLTLILPPIDQPDASDPSAVASLTRTLAKSYEQLIANDPAQWHMFSRYWID